MRTVHSRVCFRLALPPHRKHVETPVGDSDVWHPEKSVIQEKNKATALRVT